VTDNRVDTGMPKDTRVPSLARLIGQ